MNARPHKRWPSPALVISIIALFVALGGAGMAANGQALILGSSGSAANTATLKTGLTANINDRSLQLTNTNTGAAAAPLDLTAGTGRPPFTTNSAVKVTNLNVDRLDNIDSTGFLRSTGKAMDSDKLDAIDSSGFIQGKGKIHHGRLWLANPSARTQILYVPGSGAVFGECSAGGYWLDFVAEPSLEAWWWNKDGVAYRNLAALGVEDITPFTTDDYVVLLQAGRSTATTAGPDVRTATYTVTGHWTPNDCNFSAQAVAQRG
ncbi:MAG: hypothetical protein ABR583_12115 [Gaiellaceae bacterium]